MTQVLRNGVHDGDNLIQLISNRAHQQMKLNQGYMQLVHRLWPQTSDKSEVFDFKVNMQCNGYFNEVIHSLEIQDYRGGILQDISEDGDEELDDLMDSFRGSSAIIFIIDGQTLIDAMDAEDRDACHHDDIDILKQFSARTQIQFVENIFMEYKRVEDYIPPILIAISKGDIFASDFERENGIRLIKETLPSIFAVGSQMTAGITVMSLGEGLGTDVNGGLLGKLRLNTDYNIHVPVIFGIYADLCYQYEVITDTAERDGILVLLKSLRKMFTDRVQLYINGKQAREI
jgi:hypothetical protein